jgi:hypothetical protein
LSAFCGVCFDGTDYFGRGAFFEVSQYIAQISLSSSRNQQMQMIGHDHPAVQLQSFIGLAEGNASHYYVPILLPAKYISPFDHCKGDKMNSPLISYLISAFRHRLKIIFLHMLVRKKAGP